MEDKDLQDQIQAAKDAGYTDAEIQAHLDELHGTAKPLEAPAANKHHEANVGTAQAGAAALGGPAADLAIKGAELAGVGYGVKKFAIDPITRAISQMNPNATQMQNGQPFRGGMPGANVPAGSAPVAPSQGPTSFTNGANPAWDQALSQPHPSTVPAEPPTAANFLQRMGQLASRYAPLARGAAGVAAAVTPGNVGQNYAAHFPQSGPARGSEINPATGRPWTEFELARYNQQY